MIIKTERTGCLPVRVAHNTPCISGLSAACAVPVARSRRAAVPFACLPFRVRSVSRPADTSAVLDTFSPLVCSEGSEGERERERELS